MRSPEWLLSRWPGAGVQGGYLQSPPRAVIAHLIFTVFTQGIGKYLPYKVYGWWWPQVDMTLRGVLSPAGSLPVIYPDRQVIVCGKRNEERANTVTVVWRHCVRIGKALWRQTTLGFKCLRIVLAHTSSLVFTGLSQFLQSLQLKSQPLIGLQVGGNWGLVCLVSAKSKIQESIIVLVVEAMT